MHTSTEFPYHITARCVNKENFPIPLQDVWTIMEDYLFFISHAYKIEIISFVLMSNHFHMIARSPLGNISEAMNYFMGETSRHIARQSKRINQIYGGRFHRTLIDDPYYLHHVYKYVYRNPCEAGITERPHDYRFSTLFLKIGRGRFSFPIEVDSLLHSDFTRCLNWINESPVETDSEVIRNALKKKKFEVKGRNKKTGKINSLSLGPF